MKTFTKFDWSGFAAKKKIDVDKSYTVHALFPSGYSREVKVNAANKREAKKLAKIELDKDCLRVWRITNVFED